LYTGFVSGNTKEDAMKKEATGNRCAIYARVSTNQQDADMQVKELRAYAKLHGWRLDGEYIDQASGAKRNRPRLDQLMADAVKHRFDILAVWKFDRFARSTIHLVEALERFKALGIDFVSKTEGIDTTTDVGKFVFTNLAAVGELERSMIRQRVKAGLRAKRATGWHPGPKGAKHITLAMFNKVHELRKQNLTYRAIGKKLGLTAMTVWKLAKRMEF
jgi:DNA invertase Pin-like site-specific DNA recombinase